MIINILEYLETSANKFPSKVVFTDETTQINYRVFLQRSKIVGSYLTTALNGLIKKPVAVLIDRNIESLIAFFGIVYSGNFYVPIDSSLPKQRIQLMINTLQPVAILSSVKDTNLAEELHYDGKKLNFEETCSAPIDEAGLKVIRNKIIDTDPLYSIFTSGSTGTPKGVVICHRSVIDLTEQFTKIFGFSEKSIFGNQAPFDFDVSVKDISSTLKNSATMHIIPKVFFSFPIKLINYLNSKKINTVIWATSALRIVENLNSLEKDVPQYLRNIMFSGEVMPNKVLNYWRKHIPDAQYVNLYGPTEITCNCSYFIVNRSFEDNEMLPIGKAFPNTDILLLNEKNHIVKNGEVGEICIRGTSLAHGYYNNSEQTSQAFCQNPLNPHYPELIYRTGDLGKFNELGELLFLSRKDFQIKHMGHRIEMGEIELAVNALPFIEAACCLFDSTKDIIILFYQSRINQDKNILLALRKLLPKYMLPNKLIHDENLPINKNGKIDRTNLKERLVNN